MHHGLESFEGFCSLTAYDVRTHECMATWLVELSSRLDHDSRYGRYRRVRLEYPIGHDGGTVYIVGRATADDGDPDVLGRVAPLKIAVTIVHPRCATQDIVIGGRYGDSLRVDIPSAPRTQPFDKTGPISTGSGETEDPVWDAVVEILRAQTVKDRHDVSRVRRACALLFQESALEEHPRFGHILARINAHLDLLET